MVNWNKVGRGILCFFIGYVISVLVQFVIVPMIDVFDGIGGSSIIGSITWLAVILINILGMVVLPAGFLAMGITENDSSATYGALVLGVLMFFFGVLIMLKIYYWFPIMAGMFNASETIALGSFWIGAIFTWIGSTMVAPIVQVIQARQNL